MEEQSATTNEIARSVGGASTAATEVSTHVQGASDRATDISQHIDGVDEGVRVTASGAQETQQSADDLARTAEHLSELVGQFRV